MNVRLTDNQKIKVTGSDDIFNVMRQILLRDNKVDREKEHFWIICLANNNLISNIELVSLGSVNQTIVRPMNVFRIAVMKGAVKAIICHNHPSGTLQPSEEDKDITDRLIQVGKILNIHVVDHLVITTQTYMSFANTGLMEELEQSTKWVPAYELTQRIRREEKKIREEAVQAEKEKAKITKERAIKKIAKEMKRDNEPIEKIVKYTGLTPQEIEKIK